MPPPHRSRRQQRSRQAILEILGASPGPVSSNRIARSLGESGHDVSERTVRAYLKEMDEDGLTECVGRRGRVITQTGRGELNVTRTAERIDFVSSRIDRMAFQMDFDLGRREGTVVVNLSIVDPSILRECLPDILRVFDCGYAMGTQVALLGPGQAVGEVVVPPGQVGLCTVCSTTLHGVLLKHGVPVRSPFSGLLELRNRQAVRFADVISYEGCSLDPLAMFIRSGMTDYLGAIHSGTGRICVGFGEVPAESRELVNGLADRLDPIGLGAFMSIGCPGQTMLNMPVREGCCGMILIAGMNPVATMAERGHRFYAGGMAGLMEFRDLRHYSELPARLDALAPR